MTKHNANNVRIKHEYFAFLKGAKGLSEQSVDGVASAINRFETDTKHRDFKLFNEDQVFAFKKHLAEQKGQRSGKNLSKATLHATFTQLKQFFQWLSEKTGYKTRIKYSDAAFFRLSKNDTHIATAHREKRWPTLEQVKHVITSMPSGSVIERRNRAIVAFTLLTAARVNAIATMKLKHIDLQAGCFFQDARDVETKFRKTFTTFFFPVGDEILEIVVDWVRYLRNELLWGNDDPVFSTTLRGIGASKLLEVTGIERKHWSGTSSIRTIFREAFASADMPYFNPHSFRDTLVHHGMNDRLSPEQMKAISQNIGHGNVLTTLTSYGEVSYQRQGEIIRGLATPQQAAQPDVKELAKAIALEMRSSGVNA